MLCTLQAFPEFFFFRTGQTAPVPFEECTSASAEVIPGALSYTQPDPENNSGPAV